MSPKYCIGYTYSKFKFNWMAYILFSKSGNPTLSRSEVFIFQFFYSFDQNRRRYLVLFFISKEL